DALRGSKFLNTNLGCCGMTTAALGRTAANRNFRSEREFGALRLLGGLGAGLLAVAAGAALLGGAAGGLVGALVAAAFVHLVAGGAATQRRDDRPRTQTHPPPHARLHCENAFEPAAARR